MSPSLRGERDLGRLDVACPFIISALENKLNDTIQLFGMWSTKRP